MRFKGYFFIIAAALLWGMIGPVSRFAFGSGVSAIEVGFFRAVISWFFFATHAITMGKTRVHRKDMPLFIVFALVGITLFYTANLTAVEEGGAAFAAVLLYTAPAWVVLISPFIYKEVVGWKKGLAVILTILGVAGICYNGDSVASGISISGKAVVAGLISGLSYSMYYIFGKYFTSRYNSYTLFMYILPIGALGMLPFIEFSHKTPETWAVLIFLGFFSSYGANSFYYLGLKYLEPTKAVLTATLEPVITAVFAFLIWNECFSVAGFIGAALILIGVLLTIFDNRQNDENETSEEISDQAGQTL